jgi:dynein heavy chain
MGWRILFESWMNTLPEFFTEEDRKSIYSLIDWTADHLFEFIRGHIDEISPTQDQNLIKSLMKIYQSMMKDLYDKDYYNTFTDHKIRHAVI